jgi:hypothetical protein
MASSLAPKIQAWKAAAAIAKGKAVKKGSDDDHVAVCSAATDKSVGIMQTASTAAEDTCEVAVTGGGGKALLGGTVVFGDLLAPDSNGKLVATTTPGDRYIAKAEQDGVENDLIGVHVVEGLI